LHRIDRSEKPSILVRVQVPEPFDLLRQMAKLAHSFQPAIKTAHHVGYFLFEIPIRKGILEIR